MRKSRGVFSCLCAGILTLGVLTGCSGKGTVGIGAGLETGEVQENSVVIRVGDTAVRYREVRNYCYLLKEQYESSFGKKIWDYELGDGSTIGDEAKEEIINMITQLKVISATAESEKVTLTNDEKDEALQKAEKLMEKVTDKDKKSYHLSMQALEKIYEENALANKMFYISTDAADTEVTDEEARQVRIAYILIKEAGGNEAEEASDKEDVAKRAATLLKQAKKANDFLEFARENTEADSVELMIGEESTELEEEAVVAALSLKKGEISPVITGKSGYYIIYCINPMDEDATYARKEEIIEERQTSMFKKKYTEWLGEYEVDISKAFWKVFEI